MDLTYLEFKSAELDGKTDDFGDGLEDAAMVADANHPHGEGSQLYDRPNVGQFDVFPVLLQLLRLAILHTLFS